MPDRIDNPQQALNELWKDHIALCCAVEDHLAAPFDKKVKDKLLSLIVSTDRSQSIVGFVKEN